MEPIYMIIDPGKYPGEKYVITQDTFNKLPAFKRTLYKIVE